MSGGHLCATHRSTDRGGSRDLETNDLTGCGARNFFIAHSLVKNFDRCPFDSSLYHPQDALGVKASYSPKGS